MKKFQNYYNDHALHSLLTSLNVMDNAILKSHGNQGEHCLAFESFLTVCLHKKVSGSITAGIYLIRSQTSDNFGTIFSTDIINNVLAPLIVIAMALLTSTFIMFLVEERRLKFTHQAILSSYQLQPVLAKSDRNLSYSLLARYDSLRSDLLRNHVRSLHHFLRRWKMVDRVHWEHFSPMDALLLGMYAFHLLGLLPLYQCFEGQHSSDSVSVGGSIGG